MKIFIIFLFLFTFGVSLSQVNGLVQGNNGTKTEPLYGAKVKLLKAKKGVVTDEQGVFEMILPKDLPDSIVISARGYFSDTIVVDKKDRFLALNVILYSELLLPEVIVEYKRKSFSISKFYLIFTQIFT